MALRFMLVSLVATLGLDLPNGASLVRLVNSGQTWVASQWQGWKAFVAEGGAGEFLADLSTPNPTHDEAASGVEVEDLSLTALASPRVESSRIRQEVRVPDFAAALKTGASSALVEVVEWETLAVSEIEANPDAGFAAVVDEMAGAFSHPSSAGLVETNAATEAVAALEPPASNPQAAETNLADTGEIGTGSNREGERLGAAVRLTGQAVQAWLSVLQQTTPTALERP